MNVEHISSLMEQRLPRYMAAAEVTIDVNEKDRTDIVQEILAVM